MIWYAESPTHWILIPRHDFGIFEAVAWDGTVLDLRTMKQRRVLDALILEKR